MNGTVLFFFKHVINRLRLEVGHINASKMFGFDILFLLGFLPHFGKVLSILELLLLKVVLVKIMWIFFGFEVLFLTQMILESAVV